MDDNEEIKLEEDDEIITLYYDDGTKEDFYNMAELDYEGKWYVYLVPVEPTEDFADDEILVYECSEDENGEELLKAVEDEELARILVDNLNKYLSQNIEK